MCSNRRCVCVLIRYEWTTLEFVKLNCRTGIKKFCYAKWEIKIASIKKEN